MFHAVTSVTDRYAWTTYYVGSYVIRGSLHMKYKSSADSTAGDGNTISFKELYDEISANLENKIAAFQARASRKFDDER